MKSVKVSPKFQVVIPREIREKMGVRPGARFMVLPLGDCIELVPVVPIRKLRGMFRGIDTSVERDEDRI